MVSLPSQDIYAETLAVFDQREDRYEPLTTPEVAESLDAKRRTVYKRLRKLVDRGYLETKETGSNSRVWWRSPLDSHDSESQQIPSNTRDIFDNMPDGVTLHDPTDGTFIDVNQRYCELLGYTREELLELDFEAIHADVPPYTSERAERYVQRAATQGPQTFEWVDETKDGVQIPVEVHLRRTTIDGAERILAVVRDIRERRERERELKEANQQLQAVANTIEASIFIKDTEGRYQFLNQETKNMLELDPDAEIVGLTDDDLFPDEIAEQYRADDQRVLEHGDTVEIEEEVPTPEGTQTNLTLKSPLYDDDGEPMGVCAVSTDITERKERERKLQARSTAMEASIDGMAILDANEEYVFVNRSHARTYGYDDPDAFLGESWRMCYDGDELARFEEEVMPTLNEEGAWRGEAIGQRNDGSTFPQELSLTVTDDGGIVCVVRDITDRKKDEQELERQREQLAALIELNDVVRGITESVINQSTRVEIEEVVCDGLAESDSYQFSWICAIGSEGQVEPRMEAGVDGYLDEIPLSVDPDDPAGQGPTGKAARTQEIQITQRVLEDPDFELWYELAQEYGYRSSAAIPIVHEDTFYGIIGVYSERPDAFAEREREVIGQLGEVVGHAIAAVDRKRALLSEEVVELELRIPDLEEFLPDSADETVTFDQLVPIGDGSYLGYGTATGDAMEAVRSLVEAESTPHAGPVNVLTSTSDETQFEIQLTNSHLLTSVAAHGGYLQEVRIEDQEYHARIRLSPNADIRTILDAIRDTYPNTEMVSRRQMRTPAQTPQLFTQILGGRLTERQQAALEAGYYGGFFKWPRDSSGEDVADSLDIDVSTFHQHVRKAEEKVLDAIFKYS